MRSKPSRAESSYISPENTSSRRSLRERYWAHPYRNTLLGATALSLAPGAYLGFGPAVDNVSEYWPSHGSESGVSAHGGDLDVQEINIELDKLCLVGFTTEVKGAEAQLDWKEGVFDKYRRASVDMTVVSEFCQDTTEARIDVDDENKRYDLYIEDPNAIYLDTSVDFTPSEDDPSPYSVSYSGSGSLVPEAVFNAFIENTKIKEYKLPQVAGMVMDTRDDIIRTAATLKGEQAVREKCGPEIAAATKSDYKNELIRVAKNFAVGKQDYEFNVYIGSESPENPDEEFEYSFKNNHAGSLLDFEVDGGAKIDTGEVADCKIADGVVVKSGNIE